MHRPIPTMLHNFQRFYQIEPTVSGSDSTMNASSPLPICAHGIENSSSWPSPLRPAAVHAEYSFCFASIPQPGSQHTLYPRRDVAATPYSQMVLELLHGPRSVPATPHHASVPRLRLTTAGFHSRRRADFAWSHFFPRSVGFAPTASRAKGALTIAPSMLCQDQPIPSISSYSASPLRQRRTKTPSRFHSKKYLWMELALPNSLFGKAFHWHPVRSTKIIPSNTLRGSMRFRPPPGRRRYFRFFFRFRFGIRDSTRLHNSSDTVHDLTALMAFHLPRSPYKCQYLFKDKLLEACTAFLEENRIPCYDFPEHAVRVFAQMWRYGRVRKRSKTAE